MKKINDANSKTLVVKPATEWTEDELGAVNRRKKQVDDAQIRMDLGREAEKLLKNGKVLKADEEKNVKCLESRRNTSKRYQAKNSGRTATYQANRSASRNDVMSKLSHLWTKDNIKAVMAIEVKRTSARENEDNIRLIKKS
uniref:IENR2 domain-containing protein n=1 Tax=Rhabditophanes sp. KR3021 TaxID=114890 RepID=A0AC35U8Z2_9BILA